MNQLHATYRRTIQRKLTRLPWAIKRQHPVAVNMLKLKLAKRKPTTPSAKPLPYTKINSCFKSTKWLAWCWGSTSARRCTRVKMSYQTLNQELVERIRGFAESKSREDKSKSHQQWLNHFSREYGHSWESLIPTSAGITKSESRSLLAHSVPSNTERASGLRHKPVQDFRRIPDDQLSVGDNKWSHGGDRRCHPFIKPNGSSVAPCHKSSIQRRCPSSTT